MMTQCWYVEHDTLIWEYLNSSIHLAPYLEKKFRRIYAGEAYRFYRQRWEGSELSLFLRFLTVNVQRQDNSQQRS